MIALKAAEEKAFRGCTWYDIGRRGECLTKPGLDAVWGFLNQQHEQFDKNLNWVDVVTDIAPLNMPLKPQVSHTLKGS